MSWNATRSMYGQFTAMLNADSNGGTDIEIVAAQGAGKKIVVDFILVSTSAAASWFFESSTGTVIVPTIYQAANECVYLDEPMVKTAANESLTFSCTITGNVSVFVKYHVEYVGA